MSHIIGRDFGKEICESLGIEPENIRKFVLDVEPNSVVLIEVTRYVTSGEAERILKILEKYKINSMETEVTECKVEEGQVVEMTAADLPVEGTRS